MNDHEKYLQRLRSHMSEPEHLRLIEDCTDGARFGYRCWPHAGKEALAAALGGLETAEERVGVPTYLLWIVREEDDFVVAYRTSGRRVMASGSLNEVVSAICGEDE
jgi:hypothetical protein